MQRLKPTELLAVVALVTLSLSLVVPQALGDAVWGELFRLRQPDGEMVEVRIWGDEFYQVVESLDGYTLVRDPRDGIICYARLSADGDELVSTGFRVETTYRGQLALEPHLRISAKSVKAKVEAARARLGPGWRPGTRPGPPSAPSTGNVEGICLLVDFPGDGGTISPSQVDNYCNQTGYSQDGNNGSVYDYYYDVSDGTMSYTNYVPAAYYRAIHAKSYYDDPDVPFGTRAKELITEALNDLENSGFDFSKYDSNGDGYIDGINCFYAGNTSSGWSQGLWPHCGWMTTFSADGVTSSKYQITPMTDELTLGTFCHENGHMLCYWPDLYDYGYESSGIGAFCLMARRDSDTNPPEPCAYLKDLAGWTTTTLLVVPQSGLSAPSGVNSIYKFEHPTLPNEYYLIENRQQTDRDGSLPDAGLAIWHIDTTGSNDFEQMTPSEHYEVTLVQADGNWDLETGPGTGDTTDLWKAPSFTECGPETVPDTGWWNGTNSGLRISDISVSQPTMTFAFDLEPLRVEPTELFLSIGSVGGPFRPESTTYVLTNIGASVVDWTAAHAEPWLDLSQESGDLAPGASTTVTVSINAGADALSQGQYEDIVTFTNLTTGVADVRGVLLRIGLPDYFTELFNVDDNDLDNLTLTFIPDGSASFYRAFVDPATGFPNDPAGAATLSLDDDDFVEVTLSGSNEVWLYGTAYSSFYVGSNGYITFTEGDTKNRQVLDNHFNMPRISALFADLDPSAGGRVSFVQLDDRAVVTFEDVPEWTTVNSNSFQIEMLFNGIIRITYLGLDATGGMTGLSAGLGVPDGFVESDLSAYPRRQVYPGEGAVVATGTLGLALLAGICAVIGSLMIQRRGGGAVLR